MGDLPVLLVISNTQMHVVTTCTLSHTDFTLDNAAWTTKCNASSLSAACGVTLLCSGRWSRTPQLAQCSEA